MQQLPPPSRTLTAAPSFPGAELWQLGASPGMDTEGSASAATGGWVAASHLLPGGRCLMGCWRWVKAVRETF